MATYTKTVVLDGGLPKSPASGDLIDLTGINLEVNDFTVNGTSTGVTASSVSDGTGSAGFLGAAGAFSSSAVTTLALASTDTTSMIMSATDAGAKTLTIQSANAGAGAGNISLDAKSQIALTDSTLTLTMAAGALSETGMTDLTLTGSGTFTLSGTTALSLGDGTGSLELDGAGAMSLAGVTTLDLDGSGAVSINSSAGVINVGNDAVAQNINVGTGAAARTITMGNATGATSLVLTSGTAGVTINVPDSQTSAFAINDGSLNVIRVNTSSNGVEFLQALSLQAVDGTTPVVVGGGTAGAAITQFALVAIDGTAGKAFHADADGTGTLQNFVGVAQIAAAADADPMPYAVNGISNVLFDAVIATTDIGKFAYVSDGGTTAGAATLTAPSNSGDRVFKVGVVVGASGSTTAQVLLQPQFLYDVA